MTLRMAIQTFDSLAANRNLRPSTYAQRWLQCRVVVENNQALSVNLGNYRRVVMDNPATAVNEGQADNAAADALIRPIARYIGTHPDQDRRDLRERLGGQYLPVVRQVSYGKGLAHEVGLVASALVFAGAVQGNAAAIQHYAGQPVGHGPRIGVDCSGFVNGYFVSKGVYASRRHNISDYVRHRPTRCCDELPDDVLDHVLVWSDNSHIALLDDYVSRPAPLSLGIPERLRPASPGFQLSQPTLTLPGPQVPAFLTPAVLRVVESCGSGRGVKNWEYRVDTKPDRTRRATDAARWTWVMRRVAQHDSRQTVFVARRL